jgi:hypothetical protein
VRVPGCKRYDEQVVAERHEQERRVEDPQSDESEPAKPGEKPKYANDNVL